MLRASAVALWVGVVIGAASLAPTAGAQSSGGAWDPVSGTLPATRGGEPAPIQPAEFKAFTLDAPALKTDLRSAPVGALGSRASAASSATVLTLPAPDGSYQQFRVEESSIMEPGLAARHPDIKTYDGVGIDDPTATVAADTGPLGFHASVRAATGSWYIDPYYHLDTSVYISYYGRDLLDNPHGTFVENGVEGSPAPLDALNVPAARATPTVQLRTYRLALVTDPSYATYFGGAANVTAAKVTLMNRVDQFYEDESAIRMVLIADNDKLNLDTAAEATGANGPCGEAACFTAAQLTSCSAGLTRNRIVLGQIIGASNYDIGHLSLGVSGGGVASLGVVGGNAKGQGCTGLTTPVGDFYAIDYVAHEMGHQFAGNHTFNGTQSNCSGGNRNAGTSVEPGSGSSVMAYAGICSQDNLQPHSDPYWSQRSYDEIAAYTSTPRPPISEVQTVSLSGFDPTDSFTLGYGANTSAPIVDGTNYTLAAIQAALQGPSEVQTVALAGYDTDGDSYTLTYGGVKTTPIVRGQNNTAAGVGNAIHGGNEQQQVILSGFSGATQSFQVEIGGQDSAVIGFGGVGISNANVAAAINAISGFTGTVSATGSGNTGFTLTFAGASAATDVPSVSIVNCSGGCTSTVRETAKGGTGLSSWPAGATVTVGNPTDAGYTLTFSGSLQGTNVAAFSVTDPSAGVSGVAFETIAGGPGIVPVGGTAAVLGFGGLSTLNESGFQVSFGGGLANTDLAPLALTVTGATGFVGETAEGGAVGNLGVVTDTGDHAPVVTAPANTTIPTRTPFTLAGSATDEDGDPLTYMWEQNDRGAAAGTALVSNTKTAGPLFRQFGTAAAVSPTDTLLTPSPGENVVTTDPSRTFPDLAQILAGNTNAQTGQCPAAPASPAAVPAATRDCYSEFLPTAAWTGFLADHTMNFRLTARDGHVGGGGVGNAATQVTVAPLAGPFLVTSQGTAQTLGAGAPLTVTWDVAGTDVAPVSTSQVRITLSTDGGVTFPYVLAAATANDGSAAVLLPNVITSESRIKVAAVGNIYFDLSDVDLPIVAAAVASPSPAARDFGVETVGSTSAARTVTITNTGTAALHITAATLGGADAGDFAVAADACSATAAVATGDSCTIDVTFAPTATGARVASLTIASDAVASPTVIDLGGEGVAAPVPVTTTTTAPAPPPVTTTTTAPAPPPVTTTTTAAAPPAPPATTVTATTSRPPTTSATPPVSHPTSLHGVLASPAMLSGSALVAGCRTDQASITTCTVSVAGASATTAVGHRGAREATVRVPLGAPMVHRIQGALTGVPVRVGFTATGYATTRVLRASATTRLLTATLKLAPPSGRFAPGSASLSSAARRYLAHVAHVLGQAHRVTCTGYTSASASPDAAYRQHISRLRAAAACAQLRAAGLRARFSVHAAGATQPRATNATARGRAINRRFELTIAR